MVASFAGATLHDHRQIVHVRAAVGQRGRLPQGMMPLLDLDRTKIVEWARRHRLIKRVYLFGSRARGDHRPDSDIDLAVEMDLDAWFEWHPRYEKEPDLRLSHPVQLEWYRPGAGLERVGNAVEKDGVLIYERREQS
jgi:predicted nucleotidyltransferase